MTDQPPTSAPDPADSLRIDVLRGEPTAEELAALIAVVSEAYASESAAVMAEDAASRTPWSVSQRALRAPLPRGIAWGRFGG